LLIPDIIDHRFQDNRSLIPGMSITDSRIIDR
jgi:hypothetical protein